jgi:hypothetical protein
VGNEEVRDLLLVGLLGPLYLATLLPGVGFSGDVAGFQFIGRVLGIPHPTGYPLYTLVNHAFVQWAPLGSHAHRANLLSAIFAVAACLVLMRLMVRLGAGPTTALVAALLFGATRTLWSQAIMAEVYTLNILFLVLILDRLAAWQLTRRRRDFLSACALYALSFGNLTMILLLPGFLLFVWSADRGVLRNRATLLWIALFVVLGMSQYGYLLWRNADPGATRRCSPAIFVAFFRTSRAGRFVTGCSRST